MPDLNDSILNILNSIAKEEDALAKLIEAESQKIKKFLDGHPTNSEIVALNQSVTRLVNTILMKEIVLLQKLTAAIPFIEVEEEEESSSHESSNHESSNHESSNHESSNHESTNHESSSLESSNQESITHESSNHESSSDESNSHKSRRRKSSNHESSSNESSSQKSRRRKSSSHDSTSDFIKNINSFIDNMKREFNISSRDTKHQRTRHKQRSTRRRNRGD